MRTPKFNDSELNSAPYKWKSGVSSQIFVGLPQVNQGPGFSLFFIS